MLVETMFQQGRTLQGAAVIAVPAGLADEGVVRQLAIGIGRERADDRQELRDRAAIIFLIQAQQRQFGLFPQFEAQRRGEHHAVVGDMIDLRIGIADPRDQPRSDSVGE